jgi:uncharacterized protein YegL
MSLYDVTVQTTRRELTIFFLIDRSESMYGPKICALNMEFEELIPEIRKISMDSDVQVKIAVLMFSSGCQWMYSHPIPIEYFRWNSIDADGVTNLGAAFVELNSKMSENDFLSLQQKAPVVVLMMDGSPTDDYQVSLENLKNNKRFSHALKMAIAIGDEADKNVLAEFTGSKEAVIESLVISHLIKEAINSLYIWLDSPIEYEDDEPVENQLQMIFNHRINKSQKENQKSDDDKGDPSTKDEIEKNGILAVPNFDKDDYW